MIKKLIMVTAEYRKELIRLYHQNILISESEAININQLCYIRNENQLIQEIQLNNPKTICGASKILATLVWNPMTTRPNSNQNDVMYSSFNAGHMA